MAAASNDRAVSKEGGRKDDPSDAPRLPTPDDRLIHFVCVAETHRKSDDLGVTLHEGTWAVCTEILEKTGHVWEAVGPLVMSEVALRWRERSAPAHRDDPSET